MLYTHFTEELLGLQGVKITNIENSEKSTSRRCRNLHRVVSSGTASVMKSMPINFRMA